MATENPSNPLALPSYPKTFIETAKFAREPKRVFVAMPFEASHSDDLWNIIRAVCSIHQLEARRADAATYPSAVIVDVLTELERAQIVIADLTGLKERFV